MDNQKGGSHNMGEYQFHFDCLEITIPNHDPKNKMEVIVKKKHQQQKFHGERYRSSRHPEQCLLRLKLKSLRSQYFISMGCWIVVRNTFSCME